MINWILQKNLTKPSILEEIKAALNGEDELWEEIEVIPFSDQLPEIQNKAVLHIPYGSTTFILNALKNELFKTGLFFDPATFQMANYVAQWKDKVLNSDGQLLHFGELSTLVSPLEKYWFVRPNNDGKAFSGRVDSFQALVQWSKKICALELPELNRKTEIWLAAPKTIEKEWRLFIVNDKIISASRYIHKGELDESATDIPKEMLDFAKSCIAEYRLNAVYVMDIAELEQEYKLIECNCFNGTGFYQHDIEKVIQAINNFVKSSIE